jgi:hypothetical protein
MMNFFDFFDFEVNFFFKVYRIKGKTTKAAWSGYISLFFASFKNNHGRILTITDKFAEIRVKFIKRRLFFPVPDRQ